MPVLVSTLWLILYTATSWHPMTNAVIPKINYYQTTIIQDQNDPLNKKLLFNIYCHSTQLIWYDITIATVVILMHYCKQEKVNGDGAAHHRGKVLFLSRPSRLRLMVVEQGTASRWWELFGRVGTHWLFLFAFCSLVAEQNMKSRYGFISVILFPLHP